MKPSGHDVAHGGEHVTERGRDVFISHSSADAPAARELRDHLIASGYSTWIAPDDIDSSVSWAEQILAAVDECRVLVVLLSEAANGSSHVSREVSLAQSRRKPVLPIRIEGVRARGALEYLLTQVQRVDAFPPPLHAHLPRVRAQVSRLFDAPSRAGSAHAPSAPSGLAPASTAEERKTVTVLCAGIVDTSLDEDPSDPEDRRAQLLPFQELVRREIERIGGSVDRSMGDATIAVWGAPVAQEDAAERAVRSALAMLDGAMELGPGTEAGPHLAIGIATGQALVTVGERSAAAEGLVAGDVVTAAVRLKDAATPGAALVDDRTANATKERIEYAAETSITQGRRSGGVWRVVAPKSQIATDLDHRPTTELVGRELERSILLSTFDRAVRDSSVQQVTIVGEPGIGKSRLVADLAARLDDRDSLINWRHGRCLPYGDGISFWALGEIVKAQLGILESDSAAVAEAKLDAGLPGDMRDREWVKARLSSLLGVASPPATQEENFTAWRRFIEHVAASGPTVLAFEDLHWADDALLDFIEHLNEWATDVPLLLLSTTRPEMFERRPAFGRRARNSTIIELHQLNEEDTASLVQAVLAGAHIRSQTQRLVVERSGGNPLYAQEYVRLLRDRSLLDQPHADLPFPESVESLIAARLDTLATLEKAVVHDASVIGKVFWAGGVEAIGGGEPSAVGEALHDVSRRDFVRSARTSSLADESEFSFNHILVRDVSYGQIPKGKRAEKHLATARWLESRVAGRTEDLADVLAYHYSEALELSRNAKGDDLGTELAGKARHYLVLTGDRAMSLDVARAERSYDRALALAGEETADRLVILERWAAAAGQSGRLHEAVTALREVISAARLSANLVTAGRGLTEVARLLARLGDPAADVAIDEAVAVLEQEPPSGDLVDAYAELSAADAGRGDLARAIRDADRALVLARELDLPEPPRALGFKGLFRCLSGDAAGLDDLQRAVALALDRGLGREAAVIYANLAFVAGVLEGSARAIEANRLAFDFAERTGRVDMAVNIAANHVYWLYVIGSWDEALSRARSEAAIATRTGSTELRLVRGVEALVLANRGEAEQATELAGWLVEESRRSSDVQWVVPGFAVGALVAAAAGRSEEALALLAELEQHPGARADSNQYLMRVAENVRTALACGDVAMARRLTEGAPASFPMQENFLRAARAAIAEAEGAPGDAARLFTEASDAWVRFENVPELAFARLGQGRCLLAMGDTAAGLAALDKARTIFDRLGARPALDEIDSLVPGRSRESA